MKKKILFLLLSMLGAAASGQVRGNLTSVAADRERELISRERIALEAKFDAEEAACYKKFAVNGCLGAIKPKRREAMVELRQREVALNDQKRREAAADQIRKTEEKSSPEALKQAAERRTQALVDMKAREDRQRQKEGERIKLQQNEALNAADAASRVQGSQEMAKARADKRSAVASKVQKYNDKQREGLERKASRDKKLREQTKPAAKPLPTPP